MLKDNQIGWHTQVLLVSFVKSMLVMASTTEYGETE